MPSSIRDVRAAEAVAARSPTDAGIVTTTPRIDAAADRTRVRDDGPSARVRADRRRWSR